MSWRLRGRDQYIYRRPSQWDAGDIQADCLVDRSSAPTTFSSPSSSSQVLALSPLAHLLSRSPCCARTSSTMAYVLINQLVHMNIAISFAIHVPAPLPRKLSTALTSRLISTERPKGQSPALTQPHRESVSFAVFKLAGPPTSTNTRKAAHIGSGSKIWRNEAYSTRPKKCIL